MSIDFNKYAAKGNQFVNRLAREFGQSEDTAKAGRKLRAVLHALRDILTIEESIQMVAQLPMFLKAVYVEGWKIRGKKKKIKHVEDFIQLIRKYDERSDTVDFNDDEDVERTAIVVFHLLREYISLGEMQDIESILPKDLKYLTGQNIIL